MTRSLSAELLGERKPRIHSVPAYVSTSGYDALEVAESAGLILDPWQADLIVDGLGETADGRWAAFEAAEIVVRQNGKGSVLEARALAGMTILDEQLLLWSAHETKTAFEAFLRMEALFANSDELRRKVLSVSKANGDEGIVLRNGARLRFVARTKGSARGFTADTLLLDEIFALTSSHMAAMLPTLSTRPNPQVWYASTPPLDGAESKIMYSLRHRAIAGDPNLLYADWGPDVDLEDIGRLDLDDRELWRTTNPGYGYRIPESHIARERTAMDDVDFARERIGVWPREIRDDPHASPVDGKQWRADADPLSRPTTPVIFAVDVSPARTSAVIVAYGLREDGLAFAEVVDYRQHVDISWVVPRLMALHEQHRPYALALDCREGTPATALLTDLKVAGKATGIELMNRETPERGGILTLNAAEMAAACGQITDAVAVSSVRHLGQRVLDAAVENAKTRTMPEGGFGWARRLSTVDITPWVALTVARWAYVNFAPLIEEYDYDVLDSLGVD